MRAEGRHIHWVRSLGLPNDETCLCIFSARNREDVEEANRRADADYERIVAALSFDREALRHVTSVNLSSVAYRATDGQAD